MFDQSVKFDLELVSQAISRLGMILAGNSDSLVRVSDGESTHWLRPSSVMRIQPGSAMYITKVKAVIHLFDGKELPFLCTPDELHQQLYTSSTT